MQIAHIDGQSPARRFSNVHRLFAAYFELAHRRPFWFAVLTVLPLFLASVLIIKPAYETNDDPVMSLIVSGRMITTEPDEHIIFMHVGIGFVLKWLYTALPSLAWYGLHLLAMHCMAHIGMLYAIVVEDPRPRFVALYLLYAAVVGTLFLGFLQFTTTAFLLGQAGILLGLMAFSRAARGETRTARRLTAASIAALVYCSLIRWPVFFFVVTLALPAACVYAWQHRRRWRLVIAAGALVLATSATAYGLKIANDAYYWADPRWSDFYEYNELRAKFNDLLWVYYDQETAPTFAASGWSGNDLGMIISWFYDDPEVFGTAKLEEILAAYPWRKDELVLPKVKAFVAALKADKFLWPLLSLLPLSCLVLRRRVAGQFIVALTFIFVAAVVFALVAYRKAPPPRVYYPLVAFSPLLAIFLGAQFKIVDRVPGVPGRFRAIVARLGRLTHPLVVGSAAGVALFGLFSHIDGQRERITVLKQRRAKFYSELKPLVHDPSKLYVWWGAAMPVELLKPHDSLVWAANHRALHMGWPQQCPFHQDMKARFNITRMTRDLVGRPDVVLVSHPICLSLFAEYEREHFGTKVEFEGVGVVMESWLTQATVKGQETVAADAGSPGDAPVQR